MMNKVTEIMNQPKNIRNISIIAHVDHGKTALTESLTHVHMDVGEEKERGITIKSAAVSIQLSRTEQCPDEQKEIEREYLINLIDSPGTYTLCTITLFVLSPFFKLSPMDSLCPFLFEFASPIR